MKAEFAKLSTAPVRAIIYTHSHPDHSGGGGVFAGNHRPEILAHRLFVDRVPDVGRNGRDGGDQFGSTLPDALFINAGTGLEFGRHPASLPEKDRAARVIELTGGREQVLSRVRRALASKDFQWAAELTRRQTSVGDRRLGKYPAPQDSNLIFPVSD